MRAVIQRVSEASVTVSDETVGAIGPGLLVLLSIGQDDVEDDVGRMVDKIAGLRCFQDASSKFNLCVRDVDGAVLVVPQFTLHGDCRKGKRPSFTHAAQPAKAVPMYEAVVARLRAMGLTVETGSFGAHMAVRLLNDGPVTLLLDTHKQF